MAPLGTHKFVSFQGGSGGTTEQFYIDNTGLIGLPNASNTATSATGGAQSLPANPVGFIVVNIAGTNRKIPYYAT